MTPELAPIEVRQIATHTVLLSATQRATRASMESRLETFTRLLSHMRAPSWIIDTSELDDFEPGAVAVGSAYFQVFREAGGSQVVFVSGLPTARLAAFTIAFAARLPLVVAASMKEAYQLLGIGPLPPSEGKSDSDRGSGSRIRS